MGLSIVDAIARAHGAELSAHPRPGGGLVVEVSFPPSGAGRTTPFKLRPRLAFPAR